MSDISTPETDAARIFRELHERLGNDFLQKHFPNLTDEDIVEFVYTMPEMERQEYFTVVVIRRGEDLGIIGINIEGGRTENYSGDMMKTELALSRKLNDEGRKVIVVSDFSKSKIGVLGSNTMLAFINVFSMMAQHKIIFQIIVGKSGDIRFLLDIFSKIIPGGNRLINSAMAFMNEGESVEGKIDKVLEGQ